MLDVDGLASRTVEFLSRYAFGNRRNGDRIASDYENLQRDLPRVGSGRVYEPVSQIIQPSQTTDFIVFDVGSGLRSPYVFELLRERPGLEIVKIDRLTTEEVAEGLNFEDQLIDRSRTVFPVQVEQTPEDSAESWTNKLLQANGYATVKYAHADLNPKGRNRVPQHGYQVHGKRLIVTGIRNPGLLALSTVDIADHYDAELCLITPSRLGGMTDEDTDYILGSFVDRYLVRSEKAEFRRLLQDPERVKKSEEKFDFRKEDERAIGIALKQLAVLALASRLPGKFNLGLGIIEYPTYNNKTSFNDPSHVLVAESTRLRDLEDEHEARQREMELLERNPLLQPSDADDWVLRELRARFGPTAQDNY